MNETMRITKEMILASQRENGNKNCMHKELLLFDEVFPCGAIWPDDMEKASKAGLNVLWAIDEFKLTGDLRYYHRNGVVSCAKYYIDGKLSNTPGGGPAVQVWYDDGTRQIIEWERPRKERES